MATVATAVAMARELRKVEIFKYRGNVPQIEVIWVCRAMRHSEMKPTSVSSHTE